MHTAVPSLVALALALVAGCGSPAPRTPDAPTAAADPVAPAAASPAPEPAPLTLCDAVGRIVDAGFRYDFLAVEGTYISDEPSTFGVKVRVPDARECTLVVDEDTEIGELWCVLDIPDDADGRVARFDEVRAALVPCFDAETWHGVADDRDGRGWVFTSTDADAPRAELRLHTTGRSHDLIFLVVSQPHAGRAD